jgi:hypothetical protein
MGAKTGHSDTEISGSPDDRVADAFNAHFSRFEISISPEDVVVGSRRTIRKRRWSISYRVDPDNDGLPSLEFYAVHRMTNDRHVRIGGDGVMQKLDAIAEGFSYDPTCPGRSMPVRRVT